MMLNYAPPAPTPAPSSRLLSFGAIALAHLALFYALQHGLVSHAVQVLPKEIVLQLTPPAPTAPEPPKPRTVNLRKLPDLVQEIPAPPVLALPATVSPAAQTVHQPEAAAQPSRSETNTTAAPVAAAPAQPRQISAVDYIQAPQADYPPLSRRMGEEGRVTLKVVVNEKGYAERVEVQKSSGYHRLDEAAKAALQRAIFKPYLEDGKALAVVATATISFFLNA